MPTRALRPLLSTLWLLAAAAASEAQGPPGELARVRIRASGDYAAVAASGVVPFPRQGLYTTLVAEGLDAAGRPVPLGRHAPRWTTSSASIAEIGLATGPSTRVVAQQAGRATVTVSVLGRSASIGVAVGPARHDVSAGELAPEFRVARLELKEIGAAAGEEKLSGRTVLLEENGRSARIRARAYAADGRLLPADAFPVTWSTTDATVVELYGSDDSTANFVSRAAGRARLGAALQGVTVTLEGYVGDARSTADPSLTAQAPETAAQPSAVAPAPSATIQRAPAGTLTTRETAAQAPAAGAPTAQSVPLTTPVIQAVAEPAIVSATGFRAMSGPAYNQLLWNAAPAAFGYRVTRFDYVSQQRVTLKGLGGDTILKVNAVIDSAVKVGVAYGYRLRTIFKLSNGTLVASPDTGMGVSSTPKDPTAAPVLPPEFAGPMDLQAILEQIPTTQWGHTHIVRFRWNWHPGAAGYELIRHMPNTTTQTSMGAPAGWYADKPMPQIGIEFPTVPLSNTGYAFYCVRAVSPPHPVTKVRIGSAPIHVDIRADREQTPVGQKITITKGSATDRLSEAWLRCPTEWRGGPRSF